MSEDLAAAGVTISYITFSINYDAGNLAKWVQRLRPLTDMERDMIREAVGTLSGILAVEAERQEVAA